MTLLTIKEACERLRISRATLYKLVNRGALPLVKVGGKSLVTQAAIEALVHGALDHRGSGGQAWAQYYQELLNLGLTSPDSREAIVSPSFEPLIPAEASGKPASALIHEERQAR